MAAFEDTFTETSDTLLTLHVPNVGTSWALDSGDSSNLVVRALNNALVSTSVSRTFVRSDDLGDADCYVEAELSTLSGQNGRYVALRVQDSTNFIGWILAGTGGAGMRLVKVVSGNTTNLFTTQGVAGRVYRIEAEGTTIRFYEDGVQQGSDITESSFQTETKQGIVAFNTDSTIDFISTYNADVLGGSGISIAPNTINSLSVSLNPVIVFDSVLSLNPLAVNSDSISLNPTLLFGGALELTPNSVNSNSSSLNPAIQFSASINLSPGVISSLSLALNPSIEYTSALIIAPQVVNSSSISLDPLIEFKSLIDLNPLTVDSLSIALSPIISYGQVQNIGAVTAGFADDKYSVKYKLSGITVNFKE